jgi:hypothetical protein
LLQVTDGASNDCTTPDPGDIFENFRYGHLVNLIPTFRRGKLPRKYYPPQRKRPEEQELLPE